MKNIIKNLKNKTYLFLRWSQRYTQTDMVYLAKGGFWLTLGQIISAAVSFLSAIAFGNLLDPTIYGNYNYIVSLSGILGIFTLSGMNTALAQAASRGFEGSFYTGFKAKIKWSLLASLASLFLSGYYFLKGNNVLFFSLLMAAIFLPLMNSSRIYESFLAGKKLFHIQIKYTCLGQFISTIALISTIFLTNNLGLIIFVYFFSHASLNFFFFLLTKKKFKPNKKEDLKTLSYAKHLSIMGLISAIGEYLDGILLFTLVGSSQLAIYSFAILVPSQIKSLMKGNIGTLAFPKFSIKEDYEIKSNIMKKFWRILFITGVISLLYIIIAPLFYKTFLPQYQNSIPYSQLYALTFIAIPTTILTTVFEAKMKIRELYLIRIIPVIRIILLVVLIPLYGILGAIISQIGTTFSFLILLFILLKKL
jgi:O-antigen/teichoic acid export membrane protein